MHPCKASSREALPAHWSSRAEDAPATACTVRGSDHFRFRVHAHSASMMTTIAPTKGCRSGGTLLSTSTNLLSASMNEERSNGTGISMSVAFDRVATPHEAHLGSRVSKQIFLKVSASSEVEAYIAHNARARARDLLGFYLSY